MNFCPNCMRLLKVNYKKNIKKLFYVCPVCDYEEESTPAGYIIKTEYFAKITSGIEDNFDNTINDPRNPIVDKPCKNPKCNNHHITYTMDMETLNKTFICPKCRAIW